MCYWIVQNSVRHIQDIELKLTAWNRYNMTTHYQSMPWISPSPQSTVKLKINKRFLLKQNPRTTKVHKSISRFFSSLGSALLNKRRICWQPTYKAGKYKMLLYSLSSRYSAHLMLFDLQGSGFQFPISTLPYEKQATTGQCPSWNFLR